MKILEINSVCGVGSTGRICTDLAEVVSALNGECKIAYGRNNIPSKYEKISIKIGNKISQSIHVVLSRIFGKTGFYSYCSTKKFIKWIDTYKPDIIHLHNLHGYYINVKLLFDYIKENNIRTIWTLHDCWPFTGHCVHFSKMHCMKWKKQCYRCPKMHSYPKCWFKENVKNNYFKKKTLFSNVENMTIITPSKWLADLVKQSFLGQYPIRVINNGIDLSVFKPTENHIKEKYGLQNKKIILGVASAWIEDKGINDFVALSKKLDQEYRIIMVGLTKEQIKIMPKNIICIEKTNDIQNLVELYSAADVFVNPTKEDTFPTVNLESLACGTPVVTYDTGGSPETITDDCGIVTTERNINSILMAIDEICTNNKYRLQNCVKHAKSFDKYNQYNKYIDLYKELYKGD